MNRNDLIRLYAEKYNTTLKNSEEILTSTFTLIGEILVKTNEDICWRGFGSFRKKKRREKSIYNPIKDAVITVPEKHVIKFTLTHQPIEDDEEEEVEE